MYIYLWNITGKAKIMKLTNNKLENSKMGSGAFRHILHTCLSQVHK